MATIGPNYTINGIDGVFIRKIRFEKGKNKAYVAWITNYAYNSMQQAAIKNHYKKTKINKIQLKRIQEKVEKKGLTDPNTKSLYIAYDHELTRHNNVSQFMGIDGQRRVLIERNGSVVAILRAEAEIRREKGLPIQFARVGRKTLEQFKKATNQKLMMTARKSKRPVRRRTKNVTYYKRRYKYNTKSNKGQKQITLWRARQHARHQIYYKRKKTKQKSQQKLTTLQNKHNDKRAIKRATRRGTKRRRTLTRQINRLKTQINNRKRILTKQTASANKARRLWKEAKRGRKNAVTKVLRGIARKPVVRATKSRRKPKPAPIRAPSPAPIRAPSRSKSSSINLKPQRNRSSSVLSTRQSLTPSILGYSKSRSKSRSLQRPMRIQGRPSITLKPQRKRSSSVLSARQSQSPLKSYSKSRSKSRSKSGMRSISRTSTNGSSRTLMKSRSKSPTPRSDDNFIGPKRKPIKSIKLKKRSNKKRKLTTKKTSVLRATPEEIRRTQPIKRTKRKILSKTKPKRILLKPTLPASRSRSKSKPKPKKRKYQPLTRPKPKAKSRKNKK